MKAYYLTAFGGPEKMTYGELPDPAPRRGEVRVRVHAASVNPADVNLRNGALRWVMGQVMPRPLGLDFAGVVDALGPGVGSFAVGERVYGVVDWFRGRPGAHAQLVCAPAKWLRRMPAAFGFEQAAAMPVAALTAMTAVRLAGERAGKRVLVTGATGGVGHFAVQMARALGATITAVCRGAHADQARALGAARVIDYTTDDFTAAADRWDLVIDAHAHTGWKRASRVLAAGGAYANTLPTEASRIARHVLSAFLPIGRGYIANLRTQPDDYAELERLVAGGQVRPIVARVFELADAAQAFAALEAGGTVGKNVIRVG